MMQNRKSIEIPEHELEYTAIRSRGAGGQHVNKVATAIQLRFDINRSSLPDAVKQRLLKSSDRRVSQDGFITIKAQEYRSQARNRMAARDRLQEVIDRACFKGKKRIRTGVPEKSRRARLELKSRRGALKRLRSRPGNFE